MSNQSPDFQSIARNNQVFLERLPASLLKSGEHEGYQQTLWMAQEIAAGRLAVSAVPMPSPGNSAPVDGTSRSKSKKVPAKKKEKLPRKL